jgi:hypothetical protein
MTLHEDVGDARCLLDDDLGYKKPIDLKQPMLPPVTPYRKEVWFLSLSGGRK